jgi:hypothetical protein
VPMALSTLPAFTSARVRVRNARMIETSWQRHQILLQRPGDGVHLPGRTHPSNGSIPQSCCPPAPAYGAYEKVARAQPAPARHGGLEPASRLGHIHAGMRSDTLRTCLECRYFLANVTTADKAKRNTIWGVPGDGRAQGEFREDLTRRARRGIRRYQRGMNEIRKQLGPMADPYIQKIKALAPEFAWVNVTFPFGELYPRDVLDLKTRELCTVAALTVQGFSFPEFARDARWRGPDEAAARRAGVRTLAVAASSEIEAWRAPRPRPRRAGVGRPRLPSSPTRWLAAFHARRRRERVARRRLPDEQEASAGARSALILLVHPWRSSRMGPFQPGPLRTRGSAGCDLCVAPATASLVCPSGPHHRPAGWLRASCAGAGPGPRQASIPRNTTGLRASTAAVKRAQASRS